MVIESFSEEDTLKAGETIGKNAKPGQIYTLSGDLGVGKTVFTKGVAKGLGIKEPVNSPTFTIVQEYEDGKMPFYHFDVYRISDVEEMYEIGYEDYFFGQGICLIEWAELIEEEVRYTDKMFNGFFVGKIIDSAIIGLICFAGTTILGFESAAFISVVIGVTNIIPFFGPFIGAIPCALLLLLGTHPWDALYFLIFIVILQQIDGNIIGPKILGNTTGVSSFWVLFSILLFGGLWGIVGMVIAVPLFGVIYDIIRKLVNRGLRRNQQEEMRTEYDRDFHKPQEKKKLKSRKEIKDIKLLKNKK